MPKLTVFRIVDLARADCSDFAGLACQHSEGFSAWPPTPSLRPRGWDPGRALAELRGRSQLRHLARGRLGCRSSRRRRTATQRSRGLHTRRMDRCREDIHTPNLRKDITTMAVILGFGVAVVGVCPPAGGVSSGGANLEHHTRGCRYPARGRTFLLLLVVRSLAPTTGYIALTATECRWLTTLPKRKGRRRSDRKPRQCAAGQVWRRLGREGYPLLEAEPRGQFSTRGRSRRARLAAAR